MMIKNFAKCLVAQKYISDELRFREKQRQGGISNDSFISNDSNNFQTSILLSSWQRRRLNETPNKV